MLKIFDRSIDSSHPYADPLDELLVAAEARTRAVAQNLKYDHRVCQERDEQSFRSTFDDYQRDLMKAVQVHYGRRIRDAESPEFIDPVLNGNNFVPDRHDDTKFVTILDLNGLVDVYDWDRGERQILPRNDRANGTLYATLDDRERESMWSGWLDEQLDPKTEADRNDFVGRIVMLIGEFCRAGHRYNPTWVVPWEKFKTWYRDAKSGELLVDRWPEVIGLPKPAGRWLVVIRYTFADLGRLYRPTQLDAGAFGWHFPSPPWFHVAEGGRVVELGAGAEYNELMREFIHPQLCHLDRGNVLGVVKTREKTLGEIVETRRRHRTRLSNGCPGLENPAWLPQSELD